MKYVVDRIIDDIAVLEAIEDKRKMEVNVDRLPKGVGEGTVLIYNNDTFIRDEETEKDRRKIILEKFNKVRKKNDG